MKKRWISRKKYRKLKSSYNKLLDLVVECSLKLAAAEENKVIKYHYNYVYKEEKE